MEICFHLLNTAQCALHTIYFLRNTRFNVTILLLHNITTSAAYIIQQEIVIIRDATMPFFQIRSDSEYWPIPIRSDTSTIFYFFINVQFLYCVTLLCVKHNLVENLILMKNNMKQYTGVGFTWSLHAFCNINPIAQTTSGGGSRWNWTCVNASGCWKHQQTAQHLMDECPIFCPPVDLNLCHPGPSTREWLRLLGDII